MSRRDHVRWAWWIAGSCHPRQARKTDEDGPFPWGSRRFPIILLPMCSSGRHMVKVCVIALGSTVTRPHAPLSGGAIQVVCKCSLPSSEKRGLIGWAKGDVRGCLATRCGDGGRFRFLKLAQELASFLVLASVFGCMVFNVTQHNARVV